MKTFLKVLGAGVVLAVLVAGCGGTQADGSQQVRIAVTEKGFEPASVTVQAGQPVTLLVTRKTDRTCATELVLEEHGIDEELPRGRTVAIRFTPEQTGTLQYACGMDMIKGQIVVQ
jgi:plastocyanin domain-containing protein